MSRRLDRSKNTPPPVGVKFRNWEEYDAYVARVAEVGGKIGDYARVVLLRDARAAREKVS